MSEPKTIVIIGAGIVGVSTAIWLQRSGHRVCLIDRAGPGEGTSFGNGGVLASCSVVPVTGPGLMRKAPAMLLDPGQPLFLRWGYLPRLLPWLIRYLGHANAADTQRIANALAPLVGDSLADHQALAAGTGAEKWIVPGNYLYIYNDRAHFEGDAFGWGLRRDHGFRWDEIEGPALRAYDPLLADQNLTLLYSAPWPPQGLYFKDAVESVAEMKGIKFRSYNNATARLAELTGMLPVTIEAAEISQAFATGVADAMVSSGSTGYDRKVWESLNYFYEVDAWLPRNYVMVNSDVWSGVSDGNKAVITACAELAEYAGTWRAKEYTGFTLQGLRDGGMTVGPASDKMKSELQEIGKTMTAEWLEAAGDDGKAIVDAFMEMK